MSAIHAISIVPTLDVEPLSETSHATASGPPTWEFSERSVKAFFDKCAEKGLKPTYFLHPEAAIHQPDVFEDLKAKGAAIGLHFHPWKFVEYLNWLLKKIAEGQKLEDLVPEFDDLIKPLLDDIENVREAWRQDFGGLNPDAIKSILETGKTIFRRAFGFNPVLFRAGTLSASDHMYPVLEELGFEGSSTCAPGRNAPKKSAVWVSADPDPHFTNRAQKIVSGDMHVVEMPITMDLTKTLRTDAGVEMFGDLRPDDDWTKFGTDYSTMANNIVGSMLERKPAVPVINFLTHNKFEHWNEEADTTKRLNASLDAIFTALANHGIEAKCASLSDVVEEVRVKCERKRPDVIIEGMIYDA